MDKNSSGTQLPQHYPVYGEVRHLRVELGHLCREVGNHVQVLHMPTITYYPSYPHAHKMYNTFIYSIITMVNNI